MGNNKVEKEHKLRVTPIELRPPSVTPSYTLTNLEIFIYILTFLLSYYMYSFGWRIRL